MDDTGLQSALNQLPQDLEQPVAPPPATPPSPAIASASAGAPPPPTPPVETPAPEQPTTQKPPSKLGRNLKKNGLKIAGGVLMFLLLVGGGLTAYLNYTEPGQRILASADLAGQQKKWAKMLKIRESQSTLKYDTGTIRGQTDEGECNAKGGAWHKSTSSCGLADEGGGPAPSPSPEASPSPGTSPSPNPSTSPSPSPSSRASPSPSIACANLTNDKTQPTIGDSVTFTCQANFTATAAAAYFRYSVDGGSYTTSNAVTFASGATSTTYQITINKAGAWNVQCRVCTDSTATTCTAWGQAQ